MSDTTKFQVELNQVGIKKILLGEGEGQIDFTEHTTGVQVNSSPGQPSIVILQQKPSEVVIAGEGIVYVQKEKIAAELVLDMIDSKALEEAAMNEMGYGEERTLTEIIISKIKEEVVAARS